MRCINLQRAASALWLLPDLLTGAAAELLQALSLSLSGAGHVFYAAAWLCWGLCEVVPLVISAMAWVFHAATGGAQVLFRGAVAVIYFTGECLSLISSLSYSLVSSLLATGYSVLEAAVDIAPSAVECGYDMAISVSSVLFRAGAAVITFISSSISVISSLTYSLVSGTISGLVTAANLSASAVGQAIHGTAHLCSWLWNTMSVVATHGLNVSDIISRGAVTIAYVIGDAISSVFSFIFSLISRVVDFLPRDLPLWHDTEQANAHTQGQTESEDMRYDWWALTLNVVPRAIGVLLIALLLALTLNYRRWLLQQSWQVIQHYLLPQGGDNQDGGGHQLENDVAGVGNGHQLGTDRPGDGGGGHQLEIAGSSTDF